MKKSAILLIPLLIVVFCVGATGCSGGGGQPVTHQISDDWHESLVWMRQNTPDPFQDSNFLNNYSPCTIPAQDYNYPASAYWVMSWWDYGCWIIDTAKRLPIAISSEKGAMNAGLFFTAQDEVSASEVLDRLSSKYVIIDYDMALVKFYAMAILSGKDQGEFFGVFYRVAQGGTPVLLYYPEYYQSMCSRLYNFGGREWVPKETTVISWKQMEVRDNKGNNIQGKVITDQKAFTSFNEAEAFVQTNPDYIIVGADPFDSPVPLGEVQNYRLIHKSPSTVMTQEGETISWVEIFEYSS